MKKVEKARRRRVDMMRRRLLRKSWKKRYTHPISKRSMEKYVSHVVKMKPMNDWQRFVIQAMREAYGKEQRTFLNRYTTGDRSGKTWSLFE